MSRWPNIFIGPGNWYPLGLLIAAILIPPLATIAKLAVNAPSKTAVQTAVMPNSTVCWMPSLVLVRVATGAKLARFAIYIEITPVKQFFPK